MLRSLRVLNRCFSSLPSLPVIDVSRYLTQSPDRHEDCKKVAQALKDYGCLIIKDPRVKPEQNQRFLNMMEKYFQNRAELYYNNKPVPEVFPQLAFQVGATPELKEKARNHINVNKAFSDKNKATTPFPPPPDCKWRYFWNIGESTTRSISNKAPADIVQFAPTMDTWGNHMLNGCLTVAEMTAVGLGLPKETFTKMMSHSDHKLAPTGSDLVKYPVGTIFASLHYDFNFLTIHGKSRFPGLFCWTKNGERFSVSVPQGHLLLQAGKQLEWVTGGYITYGYHEVIYTKEVEEAKNRAIKQGRIPWRISSTLFSNFRENVVMEPLNKFSTPDTVAKYPVITAAEYTADELQAIELKQ